MLYNLMTVISFGILLSIMIFMSLIAGAIMSSILDDVITILRQAKRHRKENNL